MRLGRFFIGRGISYIHCFHHRNSSVSAQEKNNFPNGLIRRPLSVRRTCVHFLFCCNGELYIRQSGKREYCGLKIGDSVKNDHRFVKSGTGVVEYKAKNMSGVKAEIDKQEKIVLLFNISSAQTVTIAKGIKINDTLQTVVEVYGKEYKELWFVEGYETGIQYQDKKRDVVLEFYFNDHKVHLIELKKTGN